MTVPHLCGTIVVLGGLDMETKKQRLLRLLKRARRTTLIIPNFESIVTPEYIKDLRRRAYLTPRVLAAVVGVSEEVIIGIEEHGKPIEPALQRLLYLLGRNPELVQELYEVRTV